MSSSNRWLKINAQYIVKIEMRYLLPCGKNFAYISLKVSSCTIPPGHSWKKEQYTKIRFFNFIIAWSIKYNIWISQIFMIKVEIISININIIYQNYLECVPIIRWANFDALYIETNAWIFYMLCVPRKERLAKITYLKTQKL